MDYTEGCDQEGPVSQMMLKSVSEPSAKEKLLHERETLEIRAKEVEDALDILEKHPDIERLLTILGRRRY